MELWFRWSELWSRSAPMTGSFPERRVDVLVRLSFCFHRALRFLFSFSRLFFFRFPTILNMPYPYSVVHSLGREGV